MHKRDRIELERARILKIYRMNIRLRHSLAADEEINNTLPAIEAEYNRAVATGQPFQLEAASVFDNPSPDGKAAKKKK